MKKYALILITIFLLFDQPVFSSGKTVFEDLDKPPEGAYGGQIFAGTSLGLGLVSGSIISAENDFIKGSTYTFTEMETTKKSELQHYSFCFSISGEYMPIDHLGAKLKLSRYLVSQKSSFGKDYPNERGYILKSWNITAAPVFHVTNRKAWDVTLSPFLGYSFGKFEAAPVAKELSSYVTRDTSQQANGFIFGAELAGVFYFSGGFFLSAGIEWTRYNISISNDISRSSPSVKTYNNGSKSGTIDSYMFQLTAGYAFKN